MSTATEPTTTTTKKWQTSAGPIQSKKVAQALRDLATHGKTYRELTDSNPEGFVYIQPFGGTSEAVAARLLEIGAKYDWQVTKENHKAIIADCLAAIKEIPIVVVDRRNTPEERERIERERAAVRAENERKAIEKQAAKERHLAELKARYPWAKQDGSNHARAAANIKRELSERFPGVRFSVRSQSFSMGNSVDVHWNDGPTSTQVDKIIRAYQQGTFNGMTDCYEYDNSGEFDAWESWMGSTKYVSTHRNENPETRAKILELLQAADVKPIPNYRWEDSIEEIASQTWGATSFPAGCELIGIAERGDDERNSQTRFKLVFSEPKTQAAPVASLSEPSEPSGQGIDSEKCKIEKHFHSKHNFDFWLIVLVERVDRERFEELRGDCQERGGWYSRAWGKCPGGFAFKSEGKAREFAATL